MTAVYNTNIVRDGMVLYLDAANVKSYPGSGSTWFDISGNQYNFTVYGSPAYDSSGYFTFSNNQTTQYMMRYPFETPTTAITYMCWFRSNFTSTAQAPFTYSVGGNNEMLLYINSSTQIAPHPLGTPLSYNTENMQNVWVHFAWTRNSLSGLNIFYRDGNYLGEYTASAGTNILANGHMIIGQEADSAGGSFDANQNLDGDFSMLQVYNRVLTDAEVKRNFEATRERHGL